MVPLNSLNCIRCVTSCARPATTLPETSSMRPRGCEQCRDRIERDAVAHVPATRIVKTHGVFPSSTRLANERRSGECFPDRPQLVFGLRRLDEQDSAPACEKSFPKRRFLKAGADILFVEAPQS